MQHHSFRLILGFGLALWPLTAVAQGPAKTQPKTPAKAQAMTPEIAKRLYDLGYPAVGDNADLGVAQWRSRSGRKTIGPLTQDEAAAVGREPMPPAFGAYLGDPFKGYGVAVRQTSRTAATAMAVEDCKKNGGPSCDPGRAIVFTGQRCLALAGYKDEVGADGKLYTAFSAFVGDTAQDAKTIAVRNCASDPDGQKHCKPLFAHCADGSTSGAPAAPPVTPLAASVPPPSALPAAPSAAEIARKLHSLGYPVSGKVSDNPTVGLSQWRFRTTGKASRDPITPEEAQAIMTASIPASYGAIAGTAYSGYGLSTQSTSRDAAEADALARCQQAKGTDCDKSLPMVIADTRCLAFAGFTGVLKADGKKHTLSASGFADEPDAAVQAALSRCAQEPENAPHCQPLVTLCADGRQATRTAAQTQPAAVPPAQAPSAAPVARPASATEASARPSAEVMNKLYELGFPMAGKPYDDPVIAISQWRTQQPRPQSGALSTQEIEAILAASQPSTFVALVGDPLALHGVAAQRTSRAKAEVDAVASCRQKRGDCDGDAHVVASGRCMAFAGYKDDGAPRSFRVSALGSDRPSATANAMTRCSVKPADAAKCKPLLVVCGDERVP